MTDLLQIAVKAHGGLEAWNRLASVHVDFSIGGALWDLKGQTGLFSAGSFEGDLRAERATFRHFRDANRIVRFSPERLSLETVAGKVLEVRDHPRAAFAGHVNETPWDELHAAYFCAYALWTYTTIPFLYTYPGFETEEIEPWQEAGETYRRLKVTFPETVESHTRQQISYFGSDGLLRRHDYAVDVLGGSLGAQYVDCFENHDGIQVPHRRLVYPLGPDNHKIAEPILISIDIRGLAYVKAT